MINERSLNDFIERYQKLKDLKGEEEADDIFENKIENLKRYLLESQDLLQQTVNTVEGNTQAASLSNSTSDEIVNYALRNESHYYCPHVEEVLSSYLFKINSRTYQKAQEPKVQSGGLPYANQDKVIEIEMYKQVNKDLKIQPCGDEGIYATIDKQMPNICIHEKREMFSENFSNRVGTKQEVRFLAFKPGMLESELGVAYLDLTNTGNINKAGEQSGMVVESLSVQHNIVASSSVDWGYQ
ncbi:hypothetical protein TTHERM_00691210 (macronuclear) [Tetrahymena thermophila SB210]|uniref:Uncharacterized protein n=1 Tax=Tetrahymena thermophila (strain SB210) TaxID=312017 RepID=I7MFV8_TETTS|nr:hypothetical protein TTHERM_00691210 [Tetrahymena thermophila SB210]EAR84423.3 hypothetical protein TTHERM_00691210 [Tetrahymena thermophila SB210]|eukprot:XP_001032086.3 hypothetical protein TTHERM_00691210 [Tetrahymena thermophila SB210]